MLNLLLVCLEFFKENGDQENKIIIKSDKENAIKWLVEELVREILNPILKDWLDQNLPHMVERIVKQEIELIVNRSERLDE